MDGTSGGKDCDTRERILNAALALFAQNGYAGTHVQEIAVRAGITKPVLYYYFKSKAHLFEAVRELIGRQVQEELDRVFQATVPAPGKLARLVRRFHRAALDEDNFFHTALPLLLSPPRGRPESALHEYPHQVAEAVQSICLEGIRNGELRECHPTEVALLVLGTIDYSIRYSRAHPGQADEELPVRMLMMAVRGLLTGEP